MVSVSGKRRSTRQAATRKRSQYYEPETDDDFEISEQSEAEPELVKFPEGLPTPPRKRQKVATHRLKAKPQTRSRTTLSKSKPQSVRKPYTGYIARKRKPRKTSEELAQEREYRGPTDGRIPDWCSLPESILRDIFIFASSPLDETAGASISPNASWLMKTARICRAFAAPALEAFYRTPSLVNEMQPHDFLGLLQQPKSARYIDYNVKVRTLEIGVKNLAYQAIKMPMFDLGSLVVQLPLLQDLQVKHPIDEPPFRPIKCQKWRYPRNLFDSIEHGGIHLRTWRWTRDMIDVQSSELYQYIAKTHTLKPFQSLTTLQLCGFHMANSSPTAPAAGDENSGDSRLDLNTTFSLLPNLKDLSFISCNVVRETFLDSLPKQLHRLELCNLHEVNSEMLALFLKEGGLEMRELVLSHNPAIDLAFLPNLRSMCPKLENLFANLLFYSEMSTVNDAEPLFDDLLLDDEVPVWPTTIRHIELVHLQKFAARAAENLFGSLVDGAHELPDLRTLILNSHIDIPWRDRAGFRDKWIDLLNRVYKRRDNEHIPYLGSLRQFRLWKQAQLPQPPIQQATKDSSESNRTDRPITPPSQASNSIRRTLSHVRITPQPRRSRRVAEGQASASATPAPDSLSSEDSDEEGSARSESETRSLFIQGRCEVVDIMIDNQRPRELEYKEADFLDSEMSGDDDWQEGADGDGEDGYAW